MDKVGKCIPLQAAVAYPSLATFAVLVFGDSALKLQKTKGWLTSETGRRWRVQIPRNCHLQAWADRTAAPCKIAIIVCLPVPFTKGSMSFRP